MIVKGSAELAQNSVGLVWEDPPERAAGTNKPRHPHTDVARELRARPGEWARLPFGNGGLVSAIGTGWLSAYRPAGAFEARSVLGAIYVRYIGSRPITNRL